jgi:YegS/Rv2252/BmrU family lipid kinase
LNKILVILNPAARGERAKSLRKTIEKLSPKVIVVRETKAVGDAEAIAERAVEQGYQTIVAAGGDGTINEVVNGIGESDVTFGILPVGTMNVFALELAIPGKDLKKAWAVIEAGETRRIDLPRANDEYFVQLAGVGLDAEVVQRTSPDFKKLLGPASYVLSLAQAAAGKPPLIRVEAADGTVRAGCFLLVGNGRHYGGPVVLFKDARLDDGLLDVVLFKNQSHWDVVRYLHAIAFGAHAELPDVEYFQTKGLKVSSDTEVPVELDGEIAGTVPFEFGFAQRKLRVLAPPVDKRKKRK